MTRTRAILTIPVLVLGAVTGVAASLTAGAPAGAATAAPVPAVARAVTQAAGCLPAGGVTVPGAPTPPAGGIVVRGHGWGHGLGMSQYGAQGAARLGCTHAQILGTYYAGTHLVRRSMTAPVVLSLLSKSSRSTVTAELPVAWTSGTATAAQPAGTTWTVTRASTGIALVDNAGAVRLRAGNGATIAGSHAAHAVRVRSFVGAHTTASSDLRLRWGTVRFTATTAGTTVQEVIATDRYGTSVDKYLWGLAEVPVSWPQEALRAQVDAARTFLASRYSSGSGKYVIGVTTSAQVYRGATAEDTDIRYGSPWHTAVLATSGEQIVDGGNAVISAMYSSSHGGRSESRAYVYGSQGGYGYLTSVDDSRWDLASSNPYRSWATSFTPSDFARRVGFTSVSAVSIGAPGTAARVAGLKVTGVRNGAAATAYLTGSTLRTQLGLRSAGISVSWTQPVPVGPTLRPGQALVGDWDGDRRADVGMFRNGTFALRTATGTVTRFAFGLGGDTPVVGDWNGDGRDSVGVFRAGRWYLRNSLSSGPPQVTFGFGVAGDTPVTGRWAGGRQQGIGVVRNARWYLRMTPSGGGVQRSFVFGNPRDLPVTGDFNADGRDTPAVFRGGRFYRSNVLGAQSTTAVVFGKATDLPLSGNWDGAGGDTFGLYRSGMYYFRNDFSGGVGTGAVRFWG